MLVLFEIIEVMIWNYKNLLELKLEEFVKENNGYVLEDFYDVSGKLIVKKGELFLSFV